MVRCQTPSRGASPSESTSLFANRGSLSIQTSSFGTSVSQSLQIRPPLQRSGKTLRSSFARSLSDGQTGQMVERTSFLREPSSGSRRRGPTGKAGGGKEKARFQRSSSPCTPTKSTDQSLVLLASSNLWPLPGRWSTHSCAR